MKVPFSISARTAHLIGLENFSNADGAIIELVKNSYDADSEICVVIMDIRENDENSKIYIIDNGSGMTSDVIFKHWMTIGTDDKLINDRSNKKNRIKSGAKGIGRFALNRLGAKTEMITFVEKDNLNGTYWKVNWENFKTARILSDVNADVEQVNMDYFHNKIKEYEIDVILKKTFIDVKNYTGTILAISQLNDQWTSDNLESLYQNLEMLIPAELNSSFKLFLYDLNRLDWGGEIKPSEYKNFDYKVEANFDGEKNINIKLYRNELNLSKLESQYQKVFKRDSMKKFPYRLEDFKAKEITFSRTIDDIFKQELLNKVGKFEFIFFFLKNTIRDDRDTRVTLKYPYNSFDEYSRINWLDKFCGIRIYRDEFRVRPYGEKGDDWLGLGKRQAKSPGGVGQRMGGYRIRPNQIAGIVKISRLTNTSFEDKSSREGIQENEVFKLFKDILIEIIKIFETDRNTIMFNLSELYKSEHPEDSKTKEIVKYALKSKSTDEKSDASKLKTLAQSYQSLENNFKDAIAELSMLRGLASLGISVASFTHELKGIMIRLLPRNELLKEILLNYLPKEKFEGVRFGNPYAELENMKTEDEKLRNWISYSLDSIKRTKRNLVDINLANYFINFEKIWQPLLKKKNIKLILNIPDSFDVKLSAYEMDLDSIFNNLVLNSIASFLRSDEMDKKISINLMIDHGFISIDFTDNGIGLAKQYKNNPDVIFNAFETSTVDRDNNKVGTGMGLYIARGIVDNYKHASIAFNPIDRGFSIRTIFKIK